MKIKEIAFVLVRILALYVFIKGLGQLASLVQILYPYYFQHIMQSYDLGFFVLFSSFTGIVLILIGVIIWLKSNKIVVHITNDKETSGEEIGLEYKDIYVLGFTLVGLFLFVENIPGFFGQIVQLIQYANSEYPPASSIQTQTWIEVIVILMKLIIAIALILRAAGIYGVIRKLRELGLNKREE